MDIDSSRLVHEARQALAQAYAPYSGVKVGAALLTAADLIYTGVNIENASLGLTLCAERTAIAGAVAAEGPELRLRALAVVSSRSGPFSPCGACRQVIFEFGPEALVIFQGERELVKTPITALLPFAFRL
uniref:Cytidine deaminase n=1 Tax=Desulfobacca acetoxidans TaxID=60893 RepID=A0A7V4LDA6_9BACT